MKMNQLRRLIPASLVATCLITVMTGQAPAQQGRGVSWIWTNEGDPLKQAPAEARYFRKTFDVRNFVDEASIDVAADKSFTVWVNGTEVGKGDNPKRVYLFDIKKHMVTGKNVVAIEAKGSGGPSGLLARIGFVPNGTSRVGLSSDASWKASRDTADGWQKAGFDDSKWAAAKVLGAFGKVGPWKGLIWDAGGDDRFSVPPGFRVGLAVKDPYADITDAKKKKPFSVVNMCFDAKGRLLVSEEGGPILLCTTPDKDGVFCDVKPYCDLVKNCHGMCWVDDALLLVGNGPKGTGLYRCKDTKGTDKIDEATLLFSFNGGMGEHGPHAILHGPDNWLYVVIGNHAHAKVDKLAENSPLRRWPTGAMGPDQGKPNTTEDVLLPRQNDASGHAANILAPGGTIWRMDKDGKNVSCFSAGYRNHFDAAFAPNGELWTFDSDMEWDEGLPWYRPVRICHVTPGSDFVWRTGAANTPDYYIDSLPSAHDTGRGSPVGMDFYDHMAFPAKYRGCCFMCDWSLGIIYAVFPEKDGASYKAKVERFCTGSPLNVTDCAVAPDGSLYFVMGGRGSQGGVYRIVYGNGKAAPEAANLEGLISTWPQPQAAWSRARLQRRLVEFNVEAADFLRSGQQPRALQIMMCTGQRLSADAILKLTQNKSADLRAYGVYLLGIYAYKEGQDALVKALRDEDKLVQRRACEALIRTGLEPPVEAIWPLLADKDRFLRTAARLVLQRIDPKKWTDRIWAEKNDLVAEEGIIALCKINQAAPYADQVFARLNQAKPENAQALLDWLRTAQLAFVHAGMKHEGGKAIVERCNGLFPHEAKLVSRELAIVLAHCRKEGLTTKPVHAALLKALLAANGDRPQQIHLFYCLRLLHEGWTPEEKAQLLEWFNSTQGWSGGHSFTGFLDNILRDLNPIFTADDRLKFLAKADQLPKAAAAMVRMTPPDQALPAAELTKIYDKIAKGKPSPGGEELKNYIVRALVKNPSEQNWPYLVNGLQSSDKPLLVQLVESLRKVPTKPKADDPAPFRAVLVAASKFDDKEQPARWKMVQLLRHWGVKSFGADEGDAKPELMALARWFGQAFPKEPPLPGSLTGKPVESKWKYDELLAFLEKDPEGKKGDVARGRMVFEKAQCLKCHKFGKEGEGIGPDLSTVAKRFKRDYILESIIDPSKVISDQYRSSTLITKKGVSITGLAAPQGDTVTVLQSDGTKVTIQKGEIEQQIASLISVMPEKLLDPLNKQEIADLFAFLESEPK
jgi:putative heme-binding domain-containing protein